MSETTSDGPPYSSARRAYRILGFIHAPLFGAIVARKPFDSGEYLTAVTAFLAVGILTMGVFWHLANEHYRGNVPGK
ncbi:MAG: hypothetical protein ABEI52_08340, partial [Halobacteriaceae archaeon]